MTAAIDFNNTEALQAEVSQEFGEWGSAANCGVDNLRLLSPVVADIGIRSRSRLAEVEKKLKTTLLATEIGVLFTGKSGAYFSN